MKTTIKRLLKIVNPIDASITRMARTIAWHQNLLYTTSCCIIFAIYFLLSGSKAGLIFSLLPIVINLAAYQFSKRVQTVNPAHITIFGYIVLIVVSQVFSTQFFAVICFLGTCFIASFFLIANQRSKFVYFLLICIAGFTFIRLYFHQIPAATIEVQVINTILFLLAIISMFLFLNQYTLEITELYRKEDNQRSLLQNIVDGMPHLIYLKDTSGKYIMTNEAVLKFHGKSKKEIIDKYDFEVFQGQEALNIIKEQDKKVISTGQTLKVVTEQMNGKSKDPDFFETIKTPLFDQEGKLENILSISSKISDRIKAEKALKESEELYRLLFENAFDGIAFYDINNNRILNANRKLFPEFTEEEFLKKTALDLSPKYQPDGRLSEEKFNEIIQHLKIEKRIEFEWWLERSNGEIILTETSFYLLPPPRDHIAVIISKDITARRKAEEDTRALQTKQSELETLNREMNMYNLYATQKNSLLKNVMQDLAELYQADLREVYKKKIQKIIHNIQSNLETKQDWMEFKLHFQRIYPDFFSHITQLCPKLTEKEIKHCAYVKMGMSLSEVAELLFVDKKAVEMARYRIKKKLELLKYQKLKDVIARIN